MKNTLCAIAAVAAMVLAAAPAMAGPTDWTGPYVGVNVGGAFGSADVTTTAGTGGYFAASSITSIAANGADSLKPTGFTGGVGAGFNQQAGNWVVGVEADIDALTLNKSTGTTVTYPCCAASNYTITQGVKTTWLFTVRPRLGWTSGSTLVYATGGLAMTDLHSQATFADTFQPVTENGSKTTTKTGWTLGGGVETAVGPKWTLKAEYLYADFGNVHSMAPLVPALSSQVMDHTAKLNTSIVRFGLNMRF
jgi:outer membrane immunogenic protein